MRSLGMSINSHNESKYKKNAQKSPVHKLLKTKNKLKVRDTKASRLRRQSVLNLNAQKEFKATSWQNSHIRGR
jgi:hypothetical protein